MVGTSEGQFDVVATNYANTSAGEWARFSSASNLLGQATRLSFSDREEAKAKLQTAKSHFEAIANINDGLLRPRAMLGLAQTLETMGALGDQGAVGDAAKQFEKVIQTFPDTTIAKAASEQLERLKKNQQDDWYSWFAAQKPVADPLSQPGLFNDLGTLPDDPNVNIPGVGSLIRPDGSETKNPVDLSAPDNSDNSADVFDPLAPAEDGDLDFLNDDEVSSDSASESALDSESVVDESAPAPDTSDTDASIEPDSSENSSENSGEADDNPDQSSGDR
jgi:hypothetical protein